jgi:hypothetical protein
MKFNHNGCLVKKLHQYLGFFMLLPFIAWAITGVFFFFKPGYSVAYQPLLIETYPIESKIFPSNKSGWLEIRQLNTILGDHLMVKTVEGWQHLSSKTLIEIEQPNRTEITLLVNDAIKSNKARYGEIKTIEESLITTTTDVRITLDWNKMTLRQQGVDTDFINTIYNIHYLRWTGIKALDQVLGVVGLFLVLLLAGIGIFMTIRKNKTT